VKILQLHLLLLLCANDLQAELFNERDLNGWYSYLVDTKYEDPRSVFAVTNRMIRISGEGLGYLATKERFTNFHLALEYKWGSKNYAWGDRIGKARDSGIFIHATGPDGNSEDGGGAFMAAIECNVFQGAVGDFLLIRGKDADGSLIAPRITTTVANGRDRDGWFTWKPNGEPKTVERWGRINWKAKDPDWNDVIDFRGLADLERDGWNRLECTSNNGVIEIHLNDEMVNHATAVWPSSGKILLQCEGSEIFFRRLNLTELKLGNPKPAQPRDATRKCE
jgi:hypothetical protein